MSAIRLFRIARLFRLVRFMKGLNQIFVAFLLSLPKLGNVGAILCLLIFLYAVLGVNLFARVQYHNVHGPTANFRSFYRAVMTLIRSMTGEAWNEMMHSLGKDKYFYESVLNKHCVATMSEEEIRMYYDGLLEDSIECGNSGSFFYFFTYTMIVSFVVLNLFIAVIFEGFDDSQKSEGGELVTKCMEMWAVYDKDLRMVLPLETALEFIEEVVSSFEEIPEGEEKVAKEGMDKLTKDASPSSSTPNMDPTASTGTLPSTPSRFSRYDIYDAKVLQLRLTEAPWAVRESERFASV